jgi:hemerythrin
MDDRPQFEAKFIVGIEQVDREHRQLFEIAARVYDGLGAGDETAESVTRAAVAELLEYTATHFKSEEGLMEAAGYPGLEEHRDQHRHLLAQAQDMEMRAEFGDHYMPVELNHFIYRWLVEHIEASDRKFGEFVAAQQPTS